ncbi:MAG: transcription-repair coupling factor [Pirellulaceae bacterium]|nr:transcription-repair coupling factor [Planctomycetales bacterium]
MTTQSVQPATVDSCRQRLEQLPSSLSTLPGFSDVIETLNSGGDATLDGVWGSACGLVTAALAARATGPLVAVLASGKASDSFSSDLEVFGVERVDRFPAWESDPGERQIYDDIYADRLRTLKSLLARVSQGDRSLDAGPCSRPVIVATIQSLMQRVPSRQAITAATRTITLGESVDIDQLSRWLLQCGLHHTTAVELPGEFAVRGGIVDIFAPDWFEPVRIEFFGDQVDSMRHFDVATQRSRDTLPSIDLTVLAPDGNSELRATQGRERFVDFLPPDAWFVLVEPEQLRAEARQYEQRVDHAPHIHRFEETLKAVSQFGNAHLAALATGSANMCHVRAESVERFSGNISHLKDELQNLAEHDEIILFCQTEAEEQRLREVLTGAAPNLQHRLGFTRGTLANGFRWNHQSLILISGTEIFHRVDVPRTNRRRLGKKIDSFLELREGDLVVHLSHGVARYRGLEVLTRENQVEEHLILEFAESTKLYVPVTKIELVQKYVGGSKARPRLAKLGGKTWARQKQAAEAAVTDMASDLLEIQAQRLARPGIAFGPDTDWQREFDASFPYDETEDQLHAIEAIKLDVESTRPMDRLLCGDVGFGKTEVAMRAAFKAVDNGYQVAVLVPTTVLAEQHYRTFQRRIAEFPYQIARLSRFCTAADQRSIVKGLAEGHVDIVIGTHRLASQDVVFQNLGLVVIDEEQRFGVGVKERLKSLRTTVNVLTMTATPIPRTLHMSLTGMRDISNLETPPEERMAVETKVTRWDNELIRHAVLRELNRGGQVYFVHNRVHDIHTVCAKLSEIVPEASIRIGHGQMNENELEQVMIDFVDGKFDILLATTIIESGLDIPNANTIFIDDADRYGLADLHQLRGRVGRYKHRAYCYLLVAKHKHVTPEASRRLRAIEEFSQMGAGFAIAMRDLEFRGAGNVLGSQQSGHIAAVGYELYCQLLETAVRRLKHLPPKLTIDVNIDLPGEALIPRDYIPDQRQKIDLYRRIARVAHVDDLANLRDELLDRFGSPPASVQRMLELVELKIDAAVWQVDAIRTEQDDKYLVFDYTNAPRIEQLARMHAGRLRVVDDRSAYFTIPADCRECDSVLALAKSVLRP